VWGLCRKKALGLLKEGRGISAHRAGQPEQRSKGEVNYERSVEMRGRLIRDAGGPAGMERCLGVSTMGGRDYLKFARRAARGGLERRCNAGETEVLS